MRYTSERDASFVIEASLPELLPSALDKAATMRHVLNGRYRREDGRVYLVRYTSDETYVIRMEIN